MLPLLIVPLLWGKTEPYEHWCHDTHQGGDEHLQFSFILAKNPALCSYPKKDRLSCFTSVTAAESWSLILTNDSPSNLTNYICTAANEACPPIEAYVRPCSTIKGKRSITVACPRTLYHSVTFWLDTRGNPQEAHQNVTCFLTVLDSPGLRVFTVSPLCIGSVGLTPCSTSSVRLGIHAQAAFLILGVLSDTLRLFKTVICLEILDTCLLFIIYYDDQVKSTSSLVDHILLPWTGKLLLSCQDILLLKADCTVHSVQTTNFCFWQTASSSYMTNLWEAKAVWQQGIQNWGWSWLFLDGQVNMAG